MSSKDLYIDIRAVVSDDTLARLFEAYGHGETGLVSINTNTITYETNQTGIPGTQVRRMGQTEVSLATINREATLAVLDILSPETRR